MVILLILFSFIFNYRGDVNTYSTYLIHSILIHHNIIRITGDIIVSIIIINEIW